MSWEETSRQEIKCPCGKGKIIKRLLSDDWNRIRDESPKIHCAECSEKYIIESKVYVPKPYHDYTIYYCVEKDNPDNKIQLEL